MGRFDTSIKSYTKSEWLAFIQANLRNTVMADHSWRINDELEGEAFAHGDDIDILPEPILEGKGESPQLCLNYFPSLDVNSDVLESFDAISLDLDKLKDLKWISQSLPILILRMDEIPESGSIKSPYFISLPDCFEKDIHEISNLLKRDSYCKGLLIELPGDSEMNQVMGNLGKFWTDFICWSKALADEKASMKTLFQKIYFQNKISSSFLYEIALLRAIKIVFYNIQSSLNLNIQPCRLIAELDYKAIATSESHRLILATVASMAAGLGGVKMLNIHVDSREANSIDKVRLVRNIQLIMDNESNMSLVEDSISGSYSIEKLSTLMANSIWSFIPPEL